MMLYIYGSRRPGCCGSAAVQRVFRICIWHLGPAFERAHRREWMRTRFGFSRGAEWAYISVVVYALVHVLDSSATPFAALANSHGRFSHGMCRRVVWRGMLLITGVTAWLRDVQRVMNDLIQFVLKVTAAIGHRGHLDLGPRSRSWRKCAGWDQLFFGWKLTLDWST